MGGWRSAREESGGQSVRTSLRMWMQLSPADNWDSLLTVRSLEESPAAS